MRYNHVSACLADALKFSNKTLEAERKKRYRICIRNAAAVAAAPACRCRLDVKYTMTTFPRSVNVKRESSVLYKYYYHAVVRFVFRISRACKCEDHVKNKNVLRSGRFLLLSTENELPLPSFVKCPPGTPFFCIENFLDIFYKIKPISIIFLRSTSKIIERENHFENKNYAIHKFPGYYRPS